MNAMRTSELGPSPDAEALEAYQVSVDLRLRNYAEWLKRQIGGFPAPRPDSDAMAGRALQEIAIKFPEVFSGREAA